MHLDTLENAGLRLQLPKTLRILPQNCGLNVSWLAAQVILHHIHHAGIRSGDCTDRPIGADHEAVGAKAFKGDVDVRSNVLRLPLVPVCLRHQSGQFATYVRKRCQFTDSTRPGLQAPVLDLWLGKMIQHKTLAGKMPHKLRRYRKVSRINQDVVRQIKFFQRGNSTEEVWPQQEAIVRFALHNVANPNQLGVPRKNLQLRTDLWRLKINPADNSQNKRRGRSQFEQPSSFLERLPRLYRHASLKTGQLQFRL